MKSKVKVTLAIVGTIFISLLLVFVIYKEKNPKEKNIFDEMYYGEKKVYKRGANTPFRNIPGIHQWNRNDFIVNPSVKELSYRNNTVEERYEKKYKTKKIGEWEIDFAFHYDKNESKAVDINFSNEYQQINMDIINKYDKDKKIIKEKIALTDTTLKSEGRIITEIPKIKEYLEKNNISIKDLKETADELLYEKVIGDWEKYTNSRYSKDNLGTVKIERSSLFDGVD